MGVIYFFCVLLNRGMCLFNTYFLCVYKLDNKKQSVFAGHPFMSAKHFKPDAGTDVVQIHRNGYRHGFL